MQFIRLIFVTSLLTNTARVDAHTTIDAPPDERQHADVMIGFGARLEPTTAGADDKVLVPTYNVGIGYGWPDFGFELGFVGGNRGVTEEAPSRNVLDLGFVVRPGSRFIIKEPQRYFSRILRSAALVIGPAYEDLSKATATGSRVGLLTGFRLDVPLQMPAHAEGRVRLSVQRFWGLTEARFGGENVRDSAIETALSLAVLF